MSSTLHTDSDVDSFRIHVDFCGEIHWDDIRIRFRVKQSVGESTKNANLQDFEAKITFLDLPIHFDHYSFNKKLLENPLGMFCVNSKQFPGRLICISDRQGVKMSYL